MNEMFANFFFTIQSPTGRKYSLPELLFFDFGQWLNLSHS